MNNSDLFGRFNFSFRPPRIGARSWALGGAFVVFTVLWLIVPHGALYWLLLPALLGLLWAASYGWRPAVVTLVALLHALLDL